MSPPKRMAGSILENLKSTFPWPFPNSTLASALAPVGALSVGIIGTAIVLLSGNWMAGRVTSPARASPAARTRVAAVAATRERNARIFLIPLMVFLIACSSVLCIPSTITRRPGEKR